MHLLRQLAWSCSVLLIVVDYSSCNTQGVLTALLNACFNLIHFCFQVVEQLKGINQKRFDGIKLKIFGFIYSYSPFLCFCRCAEEGDECGRPPGRLPSIIATTQLTCFFYFISSALENISYLNVSGNFYSLMCLVRPLTYRKSAAQLQRPAARTALLELLCRRSGPGDVCLPKISRTGVL